MSSSTNSSPEPTGTPAFPSGNRSSSKGTSPTQSGAPYTVTPTGGFTVSKTSTNQKIRVSPQTSPSLGPTTPTPAMVLSDGDSPNPGGFNLLPPAADSHSSGGTSPVDNAAGLPTFALGPPASSTVSGKRGGSPTQPSSTTGPFSGGQGKGFSGGKTAFSFTPPPPTPGSNSDRDSPLPEANTSGTSVSSNRPRSGSKSGTTPIPVPLIVPRYQKKERQFNEMNLSDEGSAGEGKALSATEMLRQRSKEALTIRSGKVVYGDSVDFHAYSMYRHGKHQYHCNSIGYSSDGDLVLNKEEISSASDSEPNKMQREVVHVTSSVCLDPYKRRAMTDDEAARRRPPNASRLKKFPGIKAPKNKKLRNRLKNDHLASEMGRKVFEKFRAIKGEEMDHDGYGKASEPVFPTTFGNFNASAVASGTAEDDDEVPSSTVAAVKKGTAATSSLLNDLVHHEPDVIDARLAKRGLKLSPNVRPSAIEKHPDSAEYRFSQVSQKLKDELKRAVKTSEQLIQVINELEATFTTYLNDCEANGVEQTKKVELFLHDSYCRLICHGVATFYRLQSFSEECPGLEEGVKKTIVHHPKVTTKKPLVELPFQTLMSFLQGKPAMDQMRLDGGSSSGSPTTQRVPKQGTTTKTPSSTMSKGTTVSSSSQGAQGGFDDGGEDPIYPMTKTQKKKLKKLKKGVHQLPSSPPSTTGATVATFSAEPEEEWQ